MTEPTRSARPRRGGRRPGWTLLSVLLVLAMAASCALVFTNRVELLKLAVVLALWAAVAAAFASVIYRRQSDADRARMRDLKLVYDLQLDREISARREYELSVESQLRKELVSELRAQTADEVAGLRAELAALRASLEILFDADLSHRPELEGDRSGRYDEWPQGTAGRVTASRLDTEHRDEVSFPTDESPIIDVPEEPAPPTEFEWGTPTPATPGPAVPDPVPPSAAGGAHYREPDERERTEQFGGGRRRRRHAADDQPHGWTPPSHRPPETEPAAPFGWSSASEPSPARSEWQPAPAEGTWAPPGTPGSNWVSADTGGTTAATPPPSAAPPTSPPTSPPPTSPSPTSPPPTSPPPGIGEVRPSELFGEHRTPEPVGEHRTPDIGGHHRTAEPAGDQAEPEPRTAASIDQLWAGGRSEPAGEYVGRRRAPEPETPEPAPAPQTPTPEPAQPRRGRHSAPPETDPARPARAAGTPHAADAAGTPHAADAAGTPRPRARHIAEDDTGGYTVAELLARLQVTPSEGGRRRRREP